MLLPAAITRLIYTLCKIRGEKVVVRFLGVEMRYLELLLARLEDAEEAAAAGSAAAAATTTTTSATATAAASTASPSHWVWEERYVLLLWLSQLFLAPFDLATISSRDIDDDADLPSIPGFSWPAPPPRSPASRPAAAPGRQVPRRAGEGARRGQGAAGAPGHAQGHAGARPADALVRWALASLRLDDRPGDGPPPPPRSPYFAIGILAFLAGILAASADASDLDDYLTPIFHGTAPHVLASATASSSVPARKMAVKVVRSVAAQVLRQQPDTATAAGSAAVDLVETTIGLLLQSLADNDTPVRLAASKALAVVTLRLPPYMASQVVDAVLESLNRNVL